MTEKGKFNPFVEMLRPGEELLWFYTPPPIASSREHIDRYRRLCRMAVWRLRVPLIILFVLIWKGQRDRVITTINPVEILLTSFVSTATMFVLGLLPLFVIGYLFYRAIDRQYMLSAYAVTTERLLRYVPRKITAVPLNDVLAYTSEGDVFFENAFRTWYDIPYAQEVVNIIHDARANRLSHV